MPLPSVVKKLGAAALSFFSRMVSPFSPLHLSSKRAAVARLVSALRSHTVLQWRGNVQGVSNTWTSALASWRCASKCVVVAAANNITARWASSLSVATPRIRGNPLPSMTHTRTPSRASSQRRGLETPSSRVLMQTAASAEEASTVMVGLAIALVRSAPSVSRTSTRRADAYAHLWKTTSSRHSPPSSRRTTTPPGFTPAQSSSINWIISSSRAQRSLPLH